MRIIVDVPDDLVEYARSQGPESQVIADALREQRERVLERDEILDKLATGRADLDAGRSEVLTPELIERIRNDALGRVAAREQKLG